MGKFAECQRCRRADVWITAGEIICGQCHAARTVLRSLTFDLVVLEAAVAELRIEADAAEQWRRAQEEGAL